MPESSTAVESRRGEPPPASDSEEAGRPAAGEEEPTSRGRPLLSYPLAALGGCLYFLGFAGFDIWPLAFVALVPFFYAVELERESRSRRILGLGLAFGFVLHVGGFYWLVGFLQNFAGMNVVLSLLVASLFWAAHGLQYALFAWLYRKTQQNRWPILASAVLAFVVTEWAFPTLFPNYLAASFHQLPLMIQVADLGGVLLVGAVAVAVNAAIYEVLVHYLPGRGSKPFPWVGPASAVGLLGATLIYGAIRIGQVEEDVAAAPKWTIGVVQVNMGIFEKRDDPIEGHRRHVTQSIEVEREAEPDLLIWPESAITWFVPGHLHNLRRLTEFRDGHDRIGPLSTPLLFGGLQRRSVDGEDRSYNTAFLLDGAGEVQGTYDKTFLLAFGEYLPLGDTFPILYEWSPNSGRFTRGNHVLPLELDEYRVSTLICYEDILPSFVRLAVRESDPHLLINLTNDAWFGDTTEPWIHLALAKFRAVEHRRYLVRSTNSGVSAVVDPAGRVTSQVGVNERGNLIDEVALMTNDTLYEKFGDWPGWLSGLAIVGFVVAGRDRRRRSGS